MHFEKTHFNIMDDDFPTLFSLSYLKIYIKI